jgi:hypothetical protein|tara:strand:+ start:335 stop:478 length:144 start_codon:yes stop_codon:yes gene_type:complete
MHRLSLSANLLAKLISDKKANNLLLMSLYDSNYTPDDLKIKNMGIFE